MRGTRSTSFKSKFMNTAKTALNLDDDDDFISPTPNMEVVPGLLNYYLLDVYSPETNRLVMENGVIEITKELVHKIMGLPMEADDLSRMLYYETGNDILEE
ncbi:unnamed protein product [Lactuca saligna]|uniref:Uncharacterized protein n=1 Tax=Lactuca saligna TaxID=75948 RepID=A0AA36DZ08_LACSI|nr:unnamed protein product [Lactuca saligna]